MQRIDILWRDIPSQVLIKRGRDRGKYMLNARFQEAIDRAAMRAGKGGSDAYLEEWRRVTTSIEAEGVLTDIAEQIGRERTIGAFVNFGADYLEPGIVHRGNRGATVVGELDGSVGDRIRGVHELLQHFERVGNTTAPEGIPNPVDLVAQFASEHRSRCGARGNRALWGCS